MALIQTVSPDKAQGRMKEAYDTLMENPGSKLLDPMFSDEDFRMLLQHLDRPWAGYRKIRKGVKKRVRRHMEQAGCRSMGSYLRQLESRPELRAALEQCLYVTISRFFRDRRLWQDMELRLLPRLARKFNSPLKIWSAGCAGGEEAYSIAIVASLIGDPTTMAILATDAQATCLERACMGRYGRSSLKEMPEQLLSQYFSSRKGGRQFTIKSEKLPSIEWKQHNLLNDPPLPGPFHMIFLRNSLLTYHQGPNLQTALIRIVSVLAPQGVLVVGSHEQLPPLPCAFVRDEHCPWVYYRC